MFPGRTPKTGELIDLGERLGFVQKSGTWYSLGDVRMGQGRDNAKNYLRDNPQAADTLEKQIRENSDKLMPMAKGSKFKAKPAGKPVSVTPQSADAGDDD